MLRQMDDRIQGKNTIKIKWLIITVPIPAVRLY